MTERYGFAKMLGSWIWKDTARKPGGRLPAGTGDFGRGAGHRLRGHAADVAIALRARHPAAGTLLLSPRQRGDGDQAHCGLGAGGDTRRALLRRRLSGHQRPRLSRHPHLRDRGPALHGSARALLRGLGAVALRVADLELHLQGLPPAQGGRVAALLRTGARPAAHARLPGIALPHRRQPAGGARGLGRPRGRGLPGDDQGP